MRRMLAVGALVALTACTPRELAAWAEWHTVDPVAAEAYAALPEVQADLATGEHEVVEAPLVTRSRWDTIAWCESGGQWSHRPVTNSSGTYSGGLMIGHRWWPLFGGTDYAPQPYLASKAEQVAVAERILDANGWAAWDCA